MSSSASGASSTFTRASAHALNFYSASSQSSPFSGHSDVDRDGYLHAEHRAGGPYLCSLPALTVDLSPEHLRRPNNEQVVRTAVRILSEENIPFMDVSLVGRRSQVDPEPVPVPTVLIITNHPARDTAKRLRREVAALFPHICVEMIGEIHLLPIRCFPVEESHPIFPRWVPICEEILRKCDISEWVSVECWRWGVRESATENPVTVLVSVINKTQNTFVTSMRWIRGILAQAGIRRTDVDVLFHKSEIQRCIANPILNREASTLPAHPGMSIGIRNSSAGSSTLGGLVQLQFGKDQEWQTFGLTCFHCVYPPEQHRQSLNLHLDAETGQNT